MFYLSSFVGDGTTGNLFQPPVDGAFGISDLRGDDTRQEGLCLVWTAQGQPSRPGQVKLGEVDLDEPLPRTVSRNLESRLGLTLDSTDRLRSIIPELLLFHGTADRDKTRWNRPRANRRGWNKIVLGPHLVYDAPVVVGLLDDFNRADEALEDSANWDVSDLGGAFAVVSNALEVAAVGGGRENAWWSAEAFDADQWMSANQVQAGSNDQGICVRISQADPDPDTGSFYALRDDNSDHDIVKFVSGSFTRLLDTNDGAGDTLDVRYLEADGSTITARYDGPSGALIGQVTDTSITAGGYIGFTRVAGGSTNPRWDDFDGGNLETGVSGTAAITEAADTADGTGGVLIAGTSDIGEAADSLAAAGGVLISGTAAISEILDVLSATGAVLISGSGTIAEAADTLAASGKVLISGTGMILELADTLAGLESILFAPSQTATGMYERQTVTGKYERQQVSASYSRQVVEVAFP